MCTYLRRHPNGTYYFRMGIPTKLRPFMDGLREIKESLHLKDREAAKAVLPDHTKAAQRRLAHARLQMEAANAATASPAPLSADPFAGMTLEQFEQEQKYRFAQAWEDAAEDDRMEEAEAWAASLPPDHNAAVLLREARGERDGYRDRYRRRKRRDQSAASAGTKSASEQSLAQPAAATSLKGLFDAYVQTGRLTPAIAKEWRSGVGRFVAFIGHDDANRVTSADVLRWRNHARDEPQRNGKPRSPQRINVGYLAPLRAAFKHGISEMLIEHNPAASVPKLHVVKKEQTRDRQFTKEERRIILSAALKTGGGEGKASSYRELARRWVPWLCAYSGARVNEMTQVRAEDVQQIEGHWIIRVTPDAGRVKGKAFRNVPIHEHLIAQGFLDFVKSRGDGPLFYDPTKGDVDSERGQYKKVGERLAAWVRSIGVTDRGIMPNHAWRHTFTSLAMDAGMDERAADYIKDHASVGVSRKVYTHHTFATLAKEMALLPRYETDDGALLEQ